MIFYKDGDLLRSDCTTIMHQANCCSVMGAGIAKSIAQMYPEAEKIDKEFRLNYKDRFGWFTKAKAENGVTIVNLYGQLKPGRGLQTNYEMLEKSIDRFFKWTENGTTKANLQKIGVPYKMGCGLAGGDWAIVEKILERQSEEHNVNIFIYKL